MIYERAIYPFLKEHATRKQITVITGMRRTGKTTIVKQLLDSISSQNKLYVDLERIDNRELFSAKNYDTIIQSLARRGLSFKEKAYLVLDEIQLAGGISSVLKYLYDTYDIKFIVTGSASYYLKDVFSESLAGRKKIFELYPLGFGEFLRFKEISYPALPLLESFFLSDEYERLGEYYEEYIQFGGFPEVVLAQHADEKRDLIVDIINSYFLIDIKALTDFRNQQDIYTLMKMLASRAGTRLDYSKISRLTGLSRQTVLNYVEVFEKTYLIARIPVVSKNPDREIVKAKKIYLTDTGILNHLADVSSGTQFENTVYNQLRGKWAIAYYAQKTGDEIDFVMDHTIALEAKEHPTEQDQKTLLRLSRHVSLQKSHLIGRYAVPRFTNYIWGGAIR
ncbi:ATP-binding protein [Candidatus Uhrbacteria bacterium]|nr:ATP-binding protein [Candidatus Uhrbacteria bacterium]